ncbi:MAG: TetR/AcrR family transcriptional regulator [Myxococcales bacterium]|nr:MAG: TetR/AcrR family transcriptional regulator [Myxococcales bacterium]
MSQAAEKARNAKASMYRSLIVDAAEKLFAERGYEHTKIQDIAAESGLSLGTLYSVFGGKGAVYDAVQSDRLSAVFALAGEAMASGDSAADRLLKGNRSFIRWLTEHPDFLRIHLEGSTWATNPGEVGEDLVDAWRRGIELIASVCEEAIQQGDMYEGDPDISARLMVATQQVFMSAWVDSGMKEGPDSLADRIEQQLERALMRRER